MQVFTGDRMTDQEFNYLSHRWETHRVSTPNGEDIECYCADCGCENRGDPNEFPELEYPHCADVGDWFEQEATV